MKYIGREMQVSKYISKTFLVVDGYNIINAWPRLKRVSDEDLELAREMLVAIIHEYSKIKDYEAHVVFDAYKVKGKEEKYEDHHGVTIVYTKENQHADTYIEKFISGLSKYDQVYVATSDYAEQQIVLGKGCSRVPARELIEELDRYKDSFRKANKSRLNRFNSMNRLENKIDSDIYEKLEKIRRKKL